MWSRWRQGLSWFGSIPPSNGQLPESDTGWHVTNTPDPQGLSEESFRPISNRVILFGLALGHSVFHWIVQSFVVVLPEIQQAFLLNAVGVGGILAARELATGLVKLPAGVVADMLREHWGSLLAACLMASAVGAFLIGVSPGYYLGFDRDSHRSCLPFDLAPALFCFPFLPLPTKARRGVGHPRRGRQRGRRCGSRGYRSTLGFLDLAAVAEHLRRGAVDSWGGGSGGVPKHWPDEGAGPCCHIATGGGDQAPAENTGSVGPGPWCTDCGPWPWWPWSPCCRSTWTTSWP